VVLEKGAELGRFNMGSTVILLFEANRVRWNLQLRAGTAVRWGQILGIAA
jgi:phosphatidylserine decarboxylase